jgi:hypothetical protein
MKRGTVSPCGDGNQKTARLLRQELCRREQRLRYWAGQNRVGIALSSLNRVRRPMGTAGFVVRAQRTLGMNRASGLARIYFPL